MEVRKLFKNDFGAISILIRYWILDSPSPQGCFFILSPLDFY